MKRKHPVEIGLVCLIVFLALSILPIGNVASGQAKATSGEASESSQGVEPQCTSWVAMGSATVGRQTILSKNRDKSRQQEMVVYKPRSSGKNAYLAVTKDATTDDVGAGVNEYGLAVSCNVISGINLGGIGGLAPVGMNRQILEEHNSVETAYQHIQEKKNILYNEAVFCLADKTKTAIVEVKSQGFSMSIKPLNECLVDGLNGRPTYAGRSNRFEQFGNSAIDLTAHNRRRYERVMSYLAANNGALTPLNCFFLSRDHYYVDTKDDDGDGDYTELIYHQTTGAICNQPSSYTTSSTISGVTFVLDPQYIELSTMWLAIGAPDSAIYVPIHLGMFKSSNPAAWLPAYWTSSSAYNDSEAIRAKGWWTQPYFDACRFTFLFYEARMYNAENSASANARAQLNAGNLSAALNTLASFDSTAATSVKNNLLKVKAKTTPPPWSDLTWP